MPMNHSLISKSSYLEGGRGPLRLQFTGLRLKGGRDPVRRRHFSGPAFDIGIYGSKGKGQGQG